MDITRSVGHKNKSGPVTSPKKDTLLLAVTVLAIIACCAIFVLSSESGEVSIKMHDAALGEDDEALLRRAKALTSKYQQSDNKA